MALELDIAKLKEILLNGNHVTPKDIEEAEAYIGRKGKGAFYERLLSRGIISKDVVGQAIAESLGVAYADLNSIHPSQDDVHRIPADVGKGYRCLFFSEDEGMVVVTSDNPTQAGLYENLQAIFPEKQIKLAYSLPEDINTLLPYYEQELGVRFIQIIESKQRVAPDIIDEIVKDALAFNASDIHMDPHEDDVVIRFRLDGVLKEVGRIDKQYYESILNRIKVQAHLRTDEHFSAQDGAIRYKNEGLVTDLRVSIVPTLDGEKVVIRVLAEYVRGLSLADLGLSPGDQKLLVQASKKPFGMILISGPTGSGKTTTLYSVLKLLNTPEVNIATIEDPVEFKIIGVNHIQVNTATDLTFASGLRSIVRQDPDVILVGEIRDQETAEIAVNAALTGHLLLSTFHANDAATSIPRLLYMGVEPFLLASTLELLVSQRLVRKLCETCRFSTKIDYDELKAILQEPEKYFKEGSTVYNSKGCDACGGTGFRGRTAIYELIPVSQAMQDLILKNPSRVEIWEQARKDGAHTLFEDGIEKVKRGLTTVKELLRVAQPES